MLSFITVAIFIIIEFKNMNSLKSGSEQKMNRSEVGNCKSFPDFLCLQFSMSRVKKSGRAIRPFFAMPHIAALQM